MIDDEDRPLFDLYKVAECCFGFLKAVGLIGAVLIYLWATSDTPPAQQRTPAQIRAQLQQGAAQ